MRVDFLSGYKTYIFMAAVLVGILLSLTTLLIPHRETDEVVYQTLGRRIAELKSYSLQGTTLLPYLPKGMYDTPIFFRPPAFMVYLAALYKIAGTIGIFLAPVIVYLLLCFIIYKTVLLITRSVHTALKSLLLSLVSTQLLFASVKIHLDLFLTLMITASFFFLLFYKEHQRMLWSLFSGVFLVAAVLSKYTAVIFYPLFLMLTLVWGKKKLMSSLFFLIPSAVLAMWFYYIFFVVQMSTEALVSAPNQDMVTRYPFVKYVTERPFFFYFVSIFLINPFYLFLFLLFKKDVRQEVISKYKRIFYVLLTCVAVVILSMTYFGIKGVSYQMRYILPAEPFLIILLALIPFERYQTLRYVTFIFFINNILLLLYNFGKAEVFSFVEMMLR